MHSKKTAFIVEHDFIMAAYLADRGAQEFAAASSRARQGWHAGVIGQVAVPEEEQPHAQGLVSAPPPQMCPAPTALRCSGGV